MELPEPSLFAASVVIGAAAALFVFWHADRHGSRHPTAWGIAAFFAAIVVVPLYFLHRRLRGGRRL